MTPPVLLGVLLLVQVQDPPPPTPPSLSAFDVTKAEWLIRNRLPCLGCHELGGEGGRIGPSLSALQHGKPWEYVYAMIRDPQRVVPGSIMPRVPMSPATLELVAGYLVQRQSSRGAREGAACPTTPAPPGIATPDSSSALGRGSAAALYVRMCAPCHGTHGDGDGYNARFLPAKPTAHADSAYMSRRPDDVLFDAIYAGGYVMKRSNRMPPFGQTLTRDEIWELVRYLRSLCRCVGPAWSRDGT